MASRRSARQQSKAKDDEHDEEEKLFVVTTTTTTTTTVNRRVITTANARGEEGKRKKNLILMKLKNNAKKKGHTTIFNERENNNKQNIDGNNNDSNNDFKERLIESDMTRLNDDHKDLNKNNAIDCRDLAPESIEWVDKKWSKNEVEFDAKLLRVKTTVETTNWNTTMNNGDVRGGGDANNDSEKDLKEKDLKEKKESFQKKKAMVDKAMNDDNLENSLSEKSTRSIVTVGTVEDSDLSDFIVNKGGKIKKGRPKKQDRRSKSGLMRCKMCENTLENAPGSKFKKYFCCDTCVVNPSATFVPSLKVSVFFCQQCRKPHISEEFDLHMKSCRESLKIHRLARLKRQGKFDLMNEIMSGDEAVLGDDNLQQESRVNERRTNTKSAKRNKKDDDDVKVEDGFIPKSPNLQLGSKLSMFTKQMNSEEIGDEIAEKRVFNDGEAHARAVTEAFKNEREMYSAELTQYGIEPSLFEDALVPIENWYFSNLNIPEIFGRGITSYVTPVMTKDDRSVFAALRKSSAELDIELEVKRSWDLNKASEDGIHIKAKTATPQDLHPDLVHFVRSALKMKPIWDDDEGNELTNMEVMNTDQSAVSVGENKVQKNKLLGTIRPGCVSFSIWVNDPEVMHRFEEDQGIMDRMRRAFLLGIKSTSEDDEREQKSVILRQQKKTLMTDSECLVSDKVRPRIFHVSARAVLADKVTAITIIGANLLGENSYLNVKFNDEIEEVNLNPEENKSLHYSILPRDEYLNVTPVMIRTYVRFSNQSFKRKIGSAREGLYAKLDSFTSRFEAHPTRVKLATLQVIRDCNASDAEPIVATDSVKIYEEIFNKFSKPEDPQVMGTLTRSAFMSCAKNCEDERVATGIVSRCTADAMESLGLRSFADELRRIDKERFFVSIQKSVMTVCDPWAHIFMTCSMFASAFKPYQKVKKVTMPIVYNALAKNLLLAYLPNVLLTAILLVRKEKSERYRERYYVVLRLYTICFAIVTIQKCTSIFFRSFEMVKDPNARHLEFVQAYRCPQKAYTGGFLIVVSSGSIFTLMHSARPAWDLCIKTLHTLFQLYVAIRWQCNAVEVFHVFLIVVGAFSVLAIPGYWTQRRAWRTVWLAHPYEKRLRLKEKEELFSIGNAKLA